MPNQVKKMLWQPENRLSRARFQPWDDRGPPTDLNLEHFPLYLSVDELIEINKVKDWARSVNIPIRLVDVWYSDRKHYQTYLFEKTSAWEVTGEENQLLFRLKWT